MYGRERGAVPRLRGSSKALYPHQPLPRTRHLRVNTGVSLHGSLVTTQIAGMLSIMSLQLSYTCSDIHSSSQVLEQKDRDPAQLVPAGFTAQTGTIADWQGNFFAELRTHVAIENLFLSAFINRHTFARFEHVLHVFVFYLHNLCSIGFGSFLKQV